MITEDYVSFEIAKLLKEKGFDERTEHELWYVVEQFSTGCHWNSCTYKIGDITREYDKKYCISMPTLQMAMKWLREVHKIVCNIDIESRNFYYYNIFIIRSSIEAQYQLTSQKPYFETYEQACEAAIKYCLENLI